MFVFLDLLAKLSKYHDDSFIWKNLAMWRLLSDFGTLEAAMKP